MEKFINVKQLISKGYPISILNLDTKYYKLYKDIESVSDEYDEYSVRSLGLSVSIIPLTWDNWLLSKALKEGVGIKEADSLQVSSYMIEIQVSKS